MASDEVGDQLSISSVDSFEKLLQHLTSLDVPIGQDVRSSLSRVLAALGPSDRVPSVDVSRRFYGRVNEKMRANAAVVASVFSAAAKAGWTFNYHQKRSITRAVDQSDLAVLRQRLEGHGLPRDLVERILRDSAPLTFKESREAIRQEALSPSKLRKAHDRDVRLDVQNAAAGALVWSLWPAAKLYALGGGGGDGEEASDYLRYLQERSPALFSRDRVLSIRFLGTAECELAGRTRSALEPWLREEYEQLSNHGYIALVLNADSGGKQWAWDVACDVILVAEKFQESAVKQMFFRWKEVAAATHGAIGGSADLKGAEFELMNEGFTYRDTFVLTDSSDKVVRLVVVMQKNQRDETIIPCPGCRSYAVEGNSYPSLGVKSWECRNPLCPERSIYNRGKRYQFKSIINQAAIEDPRDLIPVPSVRRWQRDVLPFESDTEIVDTLFRHYSMSDDGVRIVNAWDGVNPTVRRRVSHVECEPESDRAAFWDSPFFKRFLPLELTQPSAVIPPPAAAFTSDAIGEQTVFAGDSTEVLASLGAGWVDRAITSPPYYNAREYSQWPNLYAYLHDMTNNALSVYRSLKPGASYAYNIFDYFDNDRTVVFSDMGKKRLVLAPLLVDIFKRIGFELCGVIPWDKGEIQGKRGFNAGNFSPFYQAPFNCWEHVIVVRKPATEPLPALAIAPSLLSKVARIRPVLKMVRGLNTHGHTAPFPVELPALLLKGLDRRAQVLDPYAGSGTTGVAALGAGLSSVLIEQDAAYYNLCRRKLREALSVRASQLALEGV